MSSADNATPTTSLFSRNLTPWKHARRLRIELHNEGVSDPRRSDHLWSGDGGNLLAEFLTNAATRLECFETNWAPIFREKQCLPRFACMRVGFTQNLFKHTNPEPEYLDQPLYRNIRRLRVCLRTEATSRSSGSRGAPTRVSLNADDVTRLCQQAPFEDDATWSTWIEDEALVQQVADAFNACPTALDEDMAWHPTQGAYCYVRRDWPLGADSPICGTGSNQPPTPVA